MAQSEYSYYSVDDHHNNDDTKKTRSGMTEKNVVPPDALSQNQNFKKAEDS